MLNSNLIKTFIALLSLSVLLNSCASKTVKAEVSDANWKKMYAILEEVKEPVFKNKTYLITDFGAVADGKFNNTEAFRKAIKMCTENGGGVVSVPFGKYYTGPIHLDNNVNLNLQEGAELLFSTNTKDFPIVHTSFEGTEFMNYSPLIYAYKKTNVAVTGKGTINGQAKNENWWSWCGKEEYGFKKDGALQNVKKLMDAAENGVPVSERIFGDGYYLRPSFVEFFECKNAMLKDIKIVDAPFWIIHPIKSTNVIIDGVSIKSHGPNNDGCDPEYSKNVIIRNCIFDTGDDCIAIKSGRDADGRRVAIASENIVVQNCKMFDGHGGVTIGSEVSAGVKNVFVENCDMDSPELDRAIRIKTNTRRGGTIENLYVRNIRVGEVKESVLGIDMFYTIHGNQTGNFIPTVQNIFLENIQVKNGGKYGFLAKGLEQSPIKNVVIKDVTIDKISSKISINNVENIQFINTKISGVLIENPIK